MNCEFVYKVDHRFTHNYCDVPQTNGNKVIGNDKPCSYEILQHYVIADQEMQENQVFQTSQDSSAMLKESTDSGFLQNTAATNDEVFPVRG